MAFNEMALVGEMCDSSIIVVIVHVPAIISALKTTNKMNKCIFYVFEFDMMANNQPQKKKKKISR